jgi:signal transduction histidine kinase
LVEVEEQQACCRRLDAGRAMTDIPHLADKELVDLKVRDNTALRKQLDRSRLEVDELRSSRKRLVEAADAERRGIERELHDGLQQDLVALTVNLQLARRLVDSDPAAAKQLIEEMRRNAQEAIDRARTLAERISPPLLETGGLGVALRSAAAEASMPVDVRVTAGAEWPPAIAGTVYLCCVAVLERLAPGATTRVDVHEEEGELAFEIIVTGTSVDMDLHLALDRVEALGGRLTISERPGQGVRVAGSVPLT